VLPRAPIPSAHPWAGAASTAEGLTPGPLCISFGSNAYGPYTDEIFVAPLLAR
jgi:hypothetical protein